LTFPACIEENGQDERYDNDRRNVTDFHNDEIEELRNEVNVSKSRSVIAPLHSQVEIINQRIGSCRYLKEGVIDGMKERVHHKHQKTNQPR
jgi:hypothetical protein